VADRIFAHRMEVDSAAIRDYLSSMSRFATMPEEERATHLARVDEFWATDPELRGRAPATLFWRTPVRRARLMGRKQDL
jgi:hypothetical protein